MFCVNCGERITSDVQYCVFCGVQMESE
ncbi:MAG: zinc-ribbon domain-containing protein [Candidatus Heimdallarchaeaceae archaeon]